MTGRKGAVRAARRRPWVALVLVAAMVAMSCGGAAPASRASQGKQDQKSPAASPPAAAPATGPANQPASVTTPLPSASSTEPSYESALAAEASRLGPTPDALLARVARGAAYEVYPGAFRGAAGTLADNVGNDVDKALLLRDLLRASKSTAAVRFATCTLPPPQVDRVIATARSAYRPPVLLPAVAAKVAPTASNPKTRNLLNALARLWNDAGAENRAESARLLADLQQAHAPLAAPSAADLRSVAASHTWLQLQNGSAWVDLDPALPDARVGASLCTPQSTAADLPGAAYDTVAVRVRVERRYHGAVDTQTAVQGSWRTADLARASLTFAFAEPIEVQLPKPSPPEPAGLVGFTPVLLAGKQIVAGSPVYVPSIEKAMGSTVAGGLNGVLGAFGGAPAPANTPPPPDVPSPVAMWLDVTVTSPGTQPVAIEDTVFDRIGYADRVANRSASAPLASIDNGEGQYLPFGSAWNIAVSAGTAIAGSGDGTRVDPKSDEPADFIRSLGSMQRAYYGLRRAIFADANAAQIHPVFNVRAGLSVAALTWHSAPDQPSPAVAGVMLDIASDHARPESGDPATAVLWATSSLMAERLATAGQQMLVAAARGGDISTVSTGDVFAVFDAARKANVAPMLVRNAGEIAAALPPDTKARLAGALGDDIVAALAPAAPVPLAGSNRAGWWLVARDGTVRDQMDTGLHQALQLYGLDLPGYAQSTNRARKQSPPFRKIGCVTKMVLNAVVVIGFAVAPAGPEGAEAGSQMAEQLRASQEAEEMEEKIREAAESASDECPIVVVFPK